MNVTMRPIMDCASKLGEMPPDASRILPRIALHESTKEKGLSLNDRHLIQMGVEY